MMVSMMPRYHYLCRIYENIVTTKRSGLYAEACAGLDAVTLSANFVCPIPGTHGWRTDPFLEVQTVDPETLDRLQGVNPKPGNLDNLIDAICHAIDSVWVPDKTHVVFHSSGLDSRILSGCIRKLYRERGRSWLGDVLFLSNRWEAKSFYEIMRLQGWNRSQYAAYIEGSADEHYGRVLDFERYWYTANAPYPHSGCVLTYLAEWAQEKGLLPSGKCLQAFNGHGCEGRGSREGAWRLQGSAEATARAIWDYASWAYYTAAGSYFPNNVHANFVLAEEGVVNAGLGWNTKRSMRKAIVDRLCPEIKHLPNMHKSDSGHPIGNQVRETAERQFAESHYARLTKTTWKAPMKSGFDRRWAIWGLASLVEHLHQQGVEIR